MPAGRRGRAQHDQTRWRHTSNILAISLGVYDRARRTFHFDIQTASTQRFRRSLSYYAGNNARSTRFQLSAIDPLFVSFAREVSSRLPAYVVSLLRVHFDGWLPPRDEMAGASERRSTLHGNYSILQRG